MIIKKYFLLPVANMIDLTSLSLKFLHKKKKAMLERILNEITLKISSRLLPKIGKLINYSDDDKAYLRRGQTRMSNTKKFQTHKYKEINE